MVVPEPEPVQKWADENSIQGDISSLCNDEVFIATSCLSCTRCFNSKLSFVPCGACTHVFFGGKCLVNFRICHRRMFNVTYKRYSYWLLLSNSVLGVFVFGGKERFKFACHVFFSRGILRKCPQSCKVVGLFVCLFV